MRSVHRPFTGMLLSAAVDAAASAPPRLPLNSMLAADRSSRGFSFAFAVCALSTRRSSLMLPKPIVSLASAAYLSPQSYSSGCSALAPSFSTPATGEGDGSDADIVEFILDDIKATEEEHANMAKGFPDDFPFTIHDDEESDFVTLKRSYKNEFIEVKVFEAEDRVVHITVSKDKGHILNFECCTNKGCVLIKDVYFKDEDEKEGPVFSDLDENIQKAFHKYLARRGISINVANFLYNYMLNRDNRNYLKWLNRLKQFVQK